MNTVNCIHAGCTEKFETNEPVSPNATFTCRYHTGPDTRNKTRFQETQFDKGSKRAKRPLGTNHIPNQGSDILDADIIAKRNEDRA